jgi:hypothetical protein
MTALKAALEREPFWCHESNRLCAGWLAMRSGKGDEMIAPWPYAEGADEEPGEVICLPDLTRAMTHV